MQVKSEDIVQQLLHLIPENGVIRSSSGTSPSHSIQSLDYSAEEITVPVQQIIEKIKTSIDNIQKENECLAQELLTCYEQLNITFKATNSVTRCKSTSEAIRVLMDEIGQAVDSRYSFYTGLLILEPSLIPENTHPAEEFLCIDRSAENDRKARKYLDQHKTDLQNSLLQDKNVFVMMIDYQGPYDLDHAGRGNILVVKLAPLDEDSQGLGTLIFVRGDDQQPFVAIDMNMAGSLAHTGSAVLRNIIYAQKLHASYLQTIGALVKAMEAKDPYTSGHSTRVAELACSLGRYIGLEGSEIRFLEWAGLLHDIGKIGIRDDVLMKAGRLTDDEFTHIKSHPVHSYHVLEPVEALHGILKSVKHHHEHYDGKGYPDALVGEEIPLHARILQVADVWDALTSTRSYRPAMSYEKAVQILNQEAGTTMDPVLVEKFIRMINENSRHSGN